MWKPFILNLASATGTNVPESPPQSPEVQTFFRRAHELGLSVPTDLQTGSGIAEATLLYRLADTLINAMRALPFDERCGKLRDALKNWSSPGTAPIPPQTAALAALGWPLVVTTNYDDLYLSAAAMTAKKIRIPDLHVVGRSLEDCHRVLRSLDEFAPPLVWAIQGFLGGQALSPDATVKRESRRRELADQVVLGHEQYQTAINGAPHFRRAFAEVFRRRSLLFLGSGLLEDYLVNLFGEIIHHHGPGPFPHFAFLAADQRPRYDPTFLQTRLGIVPIFYASHRDIPEFLATLSTLIIGHRGSSVEAYQQALTFQVTRSGSGDNRASLSVRILNEPLPVPDPKQSQCSAVSVGRWENSPLEGAMAQNHLQAAHSIRLVSRVSDGEWRALDTPPSYVYRYGEAPIFAIAARRRDLKGKNQDRRDLAIIPEAVCATLLQAESAGFETVLMGAVASGPESPWHQVHPFAQMLRGIQEFARQRSTEAVRRIDVYLVGWQVWDAVTAQKIPVSQLLSSELACHRVEFVDLEGHTESVLLTLRQAPTLGEILSLCKVNPADWEMAIYPPPSESGRNLQPELDTPIAATMTVVLTAR